jgi:hypothetical protein
MFFRVPNWIAARFSLASKSTLFRSAKLLRLNELRGSRVRSPLRGHPSWSVCPLARAPLFQL